MAMRRAEAGIWRRDNGGGEEEGRRRGALSLQNEDPRPQDGWEKRVLMGQGFGGEGRIRRRGRVSEGGEVFGAGGRVRSGGGYFRRRGKVLEDWEVF